MKRIWYDGGYIECIGIVLHKNWCCGDPAMCLCCDDCWSKCRLQQWSFQLSLAAHLTPVRQCVAHIMDYTPSDCDSNHFTPDCGILWFITPHQTYQLRKGQREGEMEQETQSRPYGCLREMDGSLITLIEVGEREREKQDNLEMIFRQLNLKHYLDGIHFSNGV